MKSSIVASFICFGTWRMHLWSAYFLSHLMSNTLEWLPCFFLYSRLYMYVYMCVYGITHDKHFISSECAHQKVISIIFCSVSIQLLFKVLVFFPFGTILFNCAIYLFILYHNKSCFFLNLAEVIIEIGTKLKENGFNHRNQKRQTNNQQKIYRDKNKRNHKPILQLCKCNDINWEIISVSTSIFFSVSFQCNARWQNGLSFAENNKPLTIAIFCNNSI